ncbi:MAG: hypothetical protein ACQCN4_05120 [Candidatus Bathyarchaeia archaeon]|jgi:hypothetical protein
MKKLTILKITTIWMYALFVILICLGQVFGSDFFTVSGLMAFTVAAALTTYYMVLTQP